MRCLVALICLFLITCNPLVAASISQAEAYEKQGNKEEALRAWKSLASEKPDDANYLYRIGRLYHSMNKQSEAKTYLLHALSLNPKDRDIRVELGFVYYDLGDEKNAKSQFETVLKEDPGDLDATKGLLLIKRHQVGKNDPRLAKLESQEEIRLLKKAEDLEKRGQYKQALNVWKRLNNDYPYRAFYLYHIGKMYHALNDQTGAQKYLLESLQIDPSDVDTKVELGYVYLDLKEFDKAKALFSEVLAKDPNYEGASKGLKLIQIREMNEKK